MNGGAQVGACSVTSCPVRQNLISERFDDGCPVHSRDLHPQICAALKRHAVLGGLSLPSQAVTLHAWGSVRPMQTGDPHCRLCCDGSFPGSRLPTTSWVRLQCFAVVMHAYQSSIHVISCSVAFAMCFSTVLMLRP